MLIGAFLWVIIATFTGLPVSTTHAITGALIGAGLVMLGQSQIQWSVLNTGFVRPLLLGPVISLVSVYLLAWPVVFIVRQLAPPREVMVSTANPIPGGAGGAPPALVVESESSRTVKGISSPGNAVHWFSG